MIKLGERHTEESKAKMRIEGQRRAARRAYQKGRESMTKWSEMLLDEQADRVVSDLQHLATSIREMCEAVDLGDFPARMENLIAGMILDIRQEQRKLKALRHKVASQAT